MPDKKSILLIHPPLAKPCEPPPGLARLAGAEFRSDDMHDTALFAAETVELDAEIPAILLHLAYLPRGTLADDGDALEIALVLHAELHVFPRGFRLPAAEVLEAYQQGDRLVLLENLLEARQELLIIGFSEFTARSERVEV